MLTTDLNEFHQSLEKCSDFPSRHQKTTSNVHRITLNGKFGVSNEWSLEGIMYNVKPMPPPKKKKKKKKKNVFSQIPQSIHGFKQKKFTGTLEFIKL